MKHGRFKDLTGKTFGERTALRFSHQIPVAGNYVWEVQCSCGRIDKVPASRLVKGKANKCVECAGRENGRIGLDSMAKGKPVYFIRCGDYVKIGCSDNIERRIKGIETNNPYPVELLKIDLTMGEKYWHDKFKDYHHRNEWYSCEIVDLT